MIACAQARPSGWVNQFAAPLMGNCKPHRWLTLQFSNTSFFTFNRRGCGSGSGRLLAKANAQWPENLARPVINEDEVLRGVEPFLHHQLDDFLARAGKDIRDGIHRLGKIMAKGYLAGIPCVSGGNEQRFPYFPRHHQCKSLGHRGGTFSGFDTSFSSAMPDSAARLKLCIGE